MIKKLSNFIKENPGILIIIIFGAVIMEYGFKEGTEDYRVIDGDTIVLNGEKVRLKGMDAPEMKQICWDNTNKEIECGKIAKQKLEEIINNNELKCDIEVNARCIGNLGNCYAGGININREMVKRGYAVAYTKHSKDFADEEKEAKRLELGFWAGEFQNPEKWGREDYKKEMGGIKKVDFLCAGDLEKSKTLPSCNNKSDEEIDKIKEEYFKYKKILEYHIIKEGYRQFNEKTYKDDIPLGIDEVAIAVYDINGDGEKEILFNIFEKGYCGSAGCSFEILKKHNKGKWRKLAMPSVDLNGIYISEGDTKLGYKDFIFSDGWDGWSIWNVWRWNGKEYDYYKKIYNLTEE